MWNSHELTDNTKSKRDSERVDPKLISWYQFLWAPAYRAYKALLQKSPAT